MERVREAQTVWRTAADRITETLAKTAPSDPAAERAKRALELFDHLAWTGDVKGLKAGGIQPTYFAHGLARAYMNPDTYRTARQFQWLRRLGEAFATKDRRRLGTIVNKDENHWVGLAIDCEEETHLGVKFRWMDLPIPSQNDVHSCGLFD
ncbi:hypothetical protein B0H14DRAFT_2895826, partial [Mycena olivaceomarginata]